MGSESRAQFYSKLQSGLNQGDIVSDVPWGVIDAPLSFCRPSPNKPGQAFYAPIAEAKRDPLPFTRGPEVIHAVGHAPTLGMVIWEDCQIEKMMNQGQDERKWYVSVAPIRPLDLFDDDESRQTVRDGRRMAFFYLPADGDIPESFVDLRLMWPVKQSLLAKRLTTLSADGRAALFGHLFTFLTARRFIGDSACPSCGAALDASTLLQDVRD